MKKINDIKKILEKNKQELRSRFRVKSIGVFGSYIRNKQKKGSDIDMLIEFTESPSLFEFMDLEDHLHQLLKIKIDLVTKNALKPYIGKYILKEVVYV